MKILIITPRVPYPINKGDKLRAYYFLKLLKKKNEIILFSLDYENVELKPNKLSEISDHFYINKLSKLDIIINIILAPFRNLPFQVSFFYSKAIENKIKKIIYEHNPDIIFCQLIRTAQLAINIKNRIKVIDYVDVISEGLTRRAKGSNFFMRFFLNLEFKKTRKYEELIYQQFDKRIIITEQDKTYLPVVNKDELHVIPNGIDAGYFKPLQTNKEYDLIFTGNMSYSPNIHAAEFIVYQILPLLKKKYPDLKILILGADTSKKVFSLRSKNTDIIGWVDDIRIYYSKAKIFIAPLKTGTGLQNKLLEAMAMEIPSITTGLVQNGIKAPINDTVIVAETAEEYANAVINLLEYPELRSKIGKSARQFVINNYNWNIIEAKLNSVFNA